MARGRSRTFDKEYNKSQRDRHEIQKLRKEVASLRKQLARVDVDRYQNLQELVEKQADEDKQLHARKKPTREEQLKRWECHECREGHLKLIILNRPDGVFYFRRCDACAHKTRMKRYTEDVEGLKE